MKHIVIVGAGIVGLSVARAACKEGYRVTVLEQAALPNPDAASNDQHRLIRYQYGAAEGYTAMVADAFAAWERVWDDVGARHARQTGVLGVSLVQGDATAKSLTTLRKLGIEHTVLDRSDAEEVCPHLTLPDGAWGLLTPTGGPLYAGRVVEALTRWLQDKTIELRPNSKVVKVDTGNGRVELEDGSSVVGDHIVIAAGAWLDELHVDTDPVVSCRQALCYVEPPARFADAWRNGPSVSDLGPGGNYILPPTDGNQLKFGSGSHRRAGAPKDGFAYDLAAESASIIANLAPYLRDAEQYRPIRIKVGYYVRDESRQFRIKHDSRATLITNCDGQMFKFGPLVGERVLDCIAGRQSATDLRDWAAGKRA